MKFVQWADIGEINKDNKAIFYALKFWWDKIDNGKKHGLGPYYSLCLPSDQHTLVLSDSIMAPEVLARDVIEKAKRYHFDSYKIDTERPRGLIPEIEVHNSPLRTLVTFDEMSKQEKRIFLDTLVRGH
jgi:hypothetical protein